MQLRPYQTEALEATLAALRQGYNPALQLATGTGKSLIIAAVAEHLRQREGRIWVLTHSQQLVGQNESTFIRYGGQDSGVVCAGLARAEYDRAVTYATIQSILRPALKHKLPAPHLIIVDEAHRIPHRSKSEGQYQRLLAEYPAARRVAFTATPWRLDEGLIYGPTQDCWFNTLAYRYTVPRAVAEGYLSSIVGVETAVQLDMAKARIAAGDYLASDVEERENEVWLRAVADSVQRLAASRRHVAVYCPTLAAAELARQVFTQVTGATGELLSGDMNRQQREAIMGRFAAQRLRFLFTVDTMTTGWDFPPLDCIVCLRPTTSSALWVQIMGRGTRLSPGKKNCLLLDYVGNLQRLGGVDTLETYVKETQPQEPVAATPRAGGTRRVEPGVTQLEPIDPMTGRKARNGSLLKLRVESVSGVGINTRRGPRLMVNYKCKSEEGVALRASLFLDTEGVQPHYADENIITPARFFNVRGLAVRLPEEPHMLTWQLRGANAPPAVVAIKQGEYWNVVREIWSS